MKRPVTLKTEYFLASNYNRRDHLDGKNINSYTKEKNFDVKQRQPERSLKQFDGNSLHPQIDRNNRIYMYFQHYTHWG